MRIRHRAGGGEGGGDGKPNDWEAKTDSQTGHTYYYSAARGRSSFTAHTHTGATTGSQEEIQTLNGRLRMLFESLCDAATGMDNKTFVDFAENSKLTGKRLGRTEVDLIFSAVKLRNKRTLDFGRFQEGVRQMATKKGVTYQELLTHVGFHAPKREEVVQATKIARWLVVTGNKEDAGQRRLMGEYTLVEGKWINGYGVWADKEGNGRYIYYASSTDEWWFSDSKEDMEAGAARGLAKVKATSFASWGYPEALTPCHTASGGWRVLVPTTEVGSSSSSSSSASFVEAIELVIRGPGQYKGNHLLMGISKEGFVMALKVLKWHEYVRDNKKFDDGKGGCWNDGPNNGYDLGVLVRSYMKEKGKSHMSFVEAVLEGEIEELRPIRKEVGTTDAFFSQVRGWVPVGASVGVGG